MSSIRKTFTAAIAAVALGATIAASATPAEARYGRNAALFGGLAIGALALGAAAAASSAPAPITSCVIERREVTNRRGDVVGYRKVRVCE